MKKNFLLVLINILFIVFNNNYAQEKNEVCLTVFVHGIMSINPHLSTTNFIRFMKDKIENTIYSKTVEFMRLEKYFYFNQAMQGAGLQKLAIDNVRKNGAPTAIARIYHEMSKITGDTKKAHFYYTFGWSGLLSASRRYKEARELFVQLETEVQKLRKEGFSPSIRLIGYSHGGNVCLNLGAVHQNIFPQSTLSIDELLLVAVPIQIETDYLVADNIFKKVYNFYSPHDRIQRIDFFSINRFFSNKYFTHRKNFKVPQKVTQIEVKFVRNRRSKKENKDRYKNLTMQFDKSNNLSGTSPLLRNVSPGHIEMWFFGWSPKHYRRDFIFKPLPALIAIPHIMNAINQLKDTLVNPYRIVADVRPEHELLLIKQYQPTAVAYALPFATHEQIQEMNVIANKAKPDKYTDRDYSNYIKTSLEKAKCHFDLNPTFKKRKNYYQASNNARTRLRMRKKRICQSNTSQEPDIISY